MSTRATYLLPTGYYSDQMVCFYIPYEGYPEGASTYFYKMYQCENMRRGYAECFFRANPDAEFAKDHEAYGDTEFRYTINHQDELIACKKGTLGNQWNIIYQGPWHQFVVRHEALYQLGVKVPAEKPNLRHSVSSFELMEVTT